MRPSRAAGAPAVRFRTHPLSFASMADLHEALRKRLRVQDVWFVGCDGRRWLGAVAPVDPSEAGLSRVITQLRADYRVRPLSISVGVFP